MLTFLGGFSAATSMIIVETIAISTMMSNNIAMPVLLSGPEIQRPGRRTLTNRILNIRRFSIFLIVLLHSCTINWWRNISPFVSISMGIVRGRSATGARHHRGHLLETSLTKGIWRASAGFVVWFFTAVIPSMARRVSLMPVSNTHGLFGISWLKPFSLFGMNGSRIVFRSMLFNIVVVFVTVSLNQTPAQETYQAGNILWIYSAIPLRRSKTGLERNGPIYPILEGLVGHFLGNRRGPEAVYNYAPASPRYPWSQAG